MFYFSSIQSRMVCLQVSLFEERECDECLLFLGIRLAHENISMKYPQTTFDWHLIGIFYEVKTVKLPIRQKGCRLQLSFP